jgi:hypothetical protein
MTVGQQYRPFLTWTEGAAEPEVERTAQRGDAGVDAEELDRVGAGVVLVTEAVRVTDAEGVAGVAAAAPGSAAATSASSSSASAAVVPESEGTTPLVSISLKFAMGTVRRQHGHHTLCSWVLRPGGEGSAVAVSFYACQAPRPFRPRKRPPSNVRDGLWLELPAREGQHRSACAYDVP